MKEEEEEEETEKKNSTNHVALPGRVPVPQLVPLPRGELRGVLRLDLRVGPPVERPGLDLVQDLPPELGEGEELGGLDRPDQRRGPHGDGHGPPVAGQGYALDDDVGQEPRVGLAADGERGVSAELPPEVVLRLAVPRQPDLAHAGDAGLADLHEEEDDLARDVAGDAVDVHVAFFFGCGWVGVGVWGCGRFELEISSFFPSILPPPPSKRKKKWRERE